jgi:ATP-dependent DNA helicase DinG
MTNLLLSFPEGYTPNKAQIEILSKLDTAINKGEKFIIVNAPTGSGKSFIPKTLANAVEGPSNSFKQCVDNYSVFGDDGPTLVMDEERFGVYALTITKTLQDQYKDTFDDTGILKGQSNYKCDLDDSMTVDIAPCIYLREQKNECWKANRCPYYNQRNDMLKSTFASLNYSMYFSLPEHLRTRKIIVCDEGSELEDQLVGQFTCEVDIPFLVKTETDVSSFPVQETPAKVLGWLKQLLVVVSDSVERYKEFLKPGNSKGSDLSKRRTEYTKLTNLQGSLKILIETFHDSQYLIEKANKIIKFIPLKVDKLSKYIFENADHVVIMSATIIDPKNFCKNLGIEKFEYIEVSSGFDAEKAPIYIMAKQKLNFQNLQSMLPKLAKQVAEILAEHKNEKGIIHTHTQAITNFMRDNVKSSRMLCREIGVKNEELLEEHFRSPQPTVLCSPSMSYGVDLKGDLAKFQIILKAPWLPTKETRIEKMMKLDKHWYSNKMLCSLVQASGRGIRSVDDECITYILDGSIYDAIERNMSKLPKFFIDRLQ